MATQVQFRRGTRAQGLAFTGAAGEATVDSDRGSKSGLRWRIHDGALAGGFLQASIADLQELEGVYGTAAQGGSPASPDELVLTHTEPILGYTEGLQIAWKQPADNTGAVQVDVDGNGFKDIRKNDSSGTPVALALGDLFANGIYTAIYDGTRFIGGGGLGSGNIFSQSFVSDEQTITAAGALTIAHGLTFTNAYEVSVRAVLINKVVEFNYSIGDVVPIYIGAQDGGAGQGRGVAVIVDGTNLKIRFGSTATVFVILDKSSGVTQVSNPANWKIRFIADA